MSSVRLCSFFFCFIFSRFIRFWMSQIWMDKERSECNSVYVCTQKNQEISWKNISINWFSSSKSERPCHWCKTIILKIMITSVPCIPQKTFLYNIWLKNDMRKFLINSGINFSKFGPNWLKMFLCLLNSKISKNIH